MSGLKAEPNPFVGMTYGQSLDEIVRKHGDKTALVYKGKRWTFADVRQEVAAASARLHALGLRPGDKLALWLPNRPEFLWYWFGAARSGIISVVLNTRLKIDEAVYQIGQSDSMALIVPGDGAFRDFAAEVASVRQQLPDLRHLITLDQSSVSDAIDWSSPPPGGQPVPADVTDAEAPALISYSSGTTALPKGALLTHCVFRKAWDIGTRVDLTANDALLMAIPLFGSMAMMNGVLPFWVRGARLVLAERFEVQDYVSLAHAERCTMTHLLPPMIISLANLPQSQLAKLATLRVGFVLSNDQQILALVADRLGIPGVMTGYGLTESTTVATRNRWDDAREDRFLTQGYAMPDVEIAVVDPTTGAPVPAGEVGEIRLRSYCIMKGYYKKPEETAKAVDANGWLHTGDAGVLRPDGRLVFLYRLSEGYKTNGFNVAPAEVEAAARLFPGIADVAAYGRNDPVAGQVGVLCIIPRANESVEPEAVIEFLKGQLASYKVPRHAVLVDELPLTAGTGKVQKFKLRDMVEPRLPKQKALV